MSRYPFWEDMNVFSQTLRPLSSWLTSHHCFGRPTFEQLQDGQRVSFIEGKGPKWPHSEKVQAI